MSVQNQDIYISTPHNWPDVYYAPFQNHLSPTLEKKKYLIRCINEGWYECVEEHIDAFNVGDKMLVRTDKRPLNKTEDSPQVILHYITEKTIHNKWIHHSVAFLENEQSPFTYTSDHTSKPISSFSK